MKTSRILFRLQYNNKTENRCKVFDQCQDPLLPLTLPPNETSNSPINRNREVNVKSCDSLS